MIEIQTGKIAVLISVYKNDNLEWFQQSVDSILNQTVGKHNIRIYLGVDGPLPDRIQDYVEKNKEQFFLISESKENKGLSVALNRLLDSLQDEEYVFRMDSDDICYLNRFEKQIFFLQNNPEIEIVGGALTEMYSDGEELGKRVYYSTHQAIVNNMYKGTAFGHPTVCFKRSAIKKFKNYSNRFPLCEDIELWFRIIKLGIVCANMKEPLIKFRVSDNFYQRRSFKKSFNELLVYLNGCLSIYHFSWKLIVPFIRFGIRILPTGLIKFIYEGKFRDKLFK